MTRSEPAPRRSLVPVPPRATLSDVAALAGVSLKTASRVFNDHPNVSDRVRRQVRHAADTLGYVPNTIARELRAGARSTLVGLIVGNLGNPFYSRLAAGAESVLVDAGLELLIASSGDDAAHERRLIDSMASRQVRGLVIVPSAPDYSFLEADVSRGMHVVFVDRPPVGLAASSVVVDNRTGIRRAVEHLAEHGHRRIALLTDSREIWTARERIDGFVEARADLRLPVEPELIVDHLTSVVEARRAVADLILSRTTPTALIAGNNVIARGAIEAIRRTDRRLALVSFDDFDTSDLLEVTTLSYQPQEIGVAAARTLVAEVTAEGRPTPSVVVLETSLIARGSGEIRPQ
jgi:LacI family transcriptional regulator